MSKKYVWLDGTTHETPDPDWTEEEAVKRGLIPSRRSDKLPVSVSLTPNPNLVYQVILNSMGSLRWDQPGLESRS
ncbi:MAG: hypothetical protein WC503_02420 [Candidatus Shapirobacteria bacterium]